MLACPSCDESMRLVAHVVIGECGSRRDCGRTNLEGRKKGLQPRVIGWVWYWMAFEFTGDLSVNKGLKVGMSSEVVVEIG